MKATPLSLIVKPTSPLVNCSDTPVMFQAKDGDWFSVTENGLQMCKSPIELTPHSFIWRNMDFGLNWSSPSTRDAKKLKALHHYQHLSTFQNTEKPNTTINQENKTESFSFLGRIRKLGKAARMKILELLHGKSKIMSPSSHTCTLTDASDIFHLMAHYPTMCHSPLPES